MNYQQIVLSGLMAHGKDAWSEHGGLLDAAMFHGDMSNLFAVIKGLYESDRMVDVISVAEKYGDHQLVQAVADNFTSAATLGDYIKELQIQHSTSRAKEIGEQLYQSGDHEAARTALEGVGDLSAKADTLDGQAALKGLWDELEAKANEDFIGLSTGLGLLDYKLGGMVAGDLILIAARPSMGKTALMLNIAKNAACPVGIFSLEMPTAKLMARMISSCGVDHGKLKHPKSLTDQDRQAMSKASTEVINSGLFINDIGGLALPALETEARRMVKKHGVGLICIDYLQLVTCKAEKRLEVVSEVSRRLKALAKNLSVPVIALSQLNRQVENTINPVPSLAHLRESGQLEQDADIVIFIDRPEQRDSSNRPGEADLIIGKNRDGEIGTVRVGWQGQYQRFTNLAGGWGETVDHGYKRSAA